MRALEPTAWIVHSLIYYGHPVVLASYNYPDKRSGALRRGMNSLAENFDGSNLKPLDRYFTNVSVSDSCTVEMVESGLTVQFRDEAAFPGCHTPDSEWISLVRALKSCIVIVTVGEFSPAAAQQHIRKQTGSGVCRGARVQFLDRRTSGFDPLTSRYKCLGPSGPRELPLPASSAVFLDSNVVLDLEKAAQGRVPEGLYAELQGLARNLWYQDCRPALAVSELCWQGINGQYRIDREASLFAAMDAWFDDRSAGSLDSSNLQSRWTDRLSYHQNRPSELSNLDIRKWIAYFYCCLLKLSSLLLQVNGFKARQRVELFTEYCRWVDNDLGVVLAYPLRIAFDSLVGDGADSHYTRKLLKFSKNVLRNIWGASWDLTMLMMSTDLPAAGKGYNPVRLSSFSLITADKALLDLRSRLTYVGMMQHAERADDWRVLTATSLSTDSRLKGHSSVIGDAVSGLLDSTIARLEPIQASKRIFDVSREIDRLEKFVLEKMAA